MPNDNDIDNVLAWGPREDPAVHHRGRAWDLTLRIVTGLAVASVVVFVAIGGANHPPSPANDSPGADPTAGQSTRSLIGPVPQPSCLEVWPDHRHLPCPWPLAKGGAKCRTRVPLPTPNLSAADALKTSNTRAGRSIDRTNSGSRSPSIGRRRCEVGVGDG
jgi:hypothetical protein